MAKVRTEAELGEALKNKEETIEIEGDLANKTFKIRATGKVAWVVAIGAISIAAYGTAATLGTGGTSAPVTATSAFIAAPVAVGVLGGAVTYSAIAIAIAAGGVGALTTLRGYKQVLRSQDRLVLKRK
ncbi:hypothetical protein [Nitrosomonas sp. H1_AOB3]|uniref:hypothetical protein n=1 Tax=Nitrosomonas sp. H1_AOB3 TaxID=2741553 RepID=UPI001934D02E|nr:hypothetical protein [Nitrosomonas sp. H1_AOB3]QOJ08141.1 MAG: hypothetical protein HRU73_00750 [Nitrosomonas sp. H1_AOB3]